MKTFKEWMKSYYIRHGFISSNPELEAAWNASAENSAEEIAKRDESIESLTAAGAEYQRQCFDQTKRIKELEEDRDTWKARLEFSFTQQAMLWAAEIARLKAVIGKCEEAFDALNKEAKAFMSYENARNNFSDDTDERKAYDRAMLKASFATKEALAAIKEIEHATD